MTNSTNKPLFHSRIIIFTITLFLTAFFGGVLYCQNLYQAGKRKDIAPVIIGCLLWNFLSSKVLTYLSVQNSALQLFIPNIISGIVLITILWNYNFKDIQEYKLQKPWYPIAAIIFVYGVLTIGNLLLKR